MAISSKFLRNQLAATKDFVDDCSLELVRKGQDALGELMARAHQRKADCVPLPFTEFAAEWILPRSVTQDGGVLYLHGGGYVAGGLDYARGFGMTLAAEYDLPVLSVAYRLAPEFPFPAAVEDATTAYRHLLRCGYPPSKIVLVGESAGGGLCFSLLLQLKKLGLPLPAGTVALSPWTDLTLSGPTYTENAELDPSLSPARLCYYARQYCPEPADRKDPLASPLFGDLTGLPPSLIIVGGDEILLSDSTVLAERLQAAGCRAELRVAPGMWHVYPVYGVKEAEEDNIRIGEFFKEVTDHA